jgi:hypothetical protein
MCIALSTKNSHHGMTVCAIHFDGLHGKLEKEIQEVRSKGAVSLLLLNLTRK